MPRKTTPATTSDPRAHFGLRATPFTRELPISQRWHETLYDEPLNELQAAVEQRESAALIAPAGSGKTVILRALTNELSGARFRVHYIKVTSLGKRDLCREIAAVIGLTPCGTYPALVRRLQERFESSATDDGRRPVLLVDEAHDMRPEVLGIFRVLTNFDLDSRLVLSLVFCGQPRLRKLLLHEDGEALAQRLALITTLRNLSRDEVRDYVSHRLNIAGAANELFDNGALDALYEVTRGNLRAIDRVAFKALELAARRDNTVVNPSLIAEARKKVIA